MMIILGVIGRGSLLSEITAGTERETGERPIGLAADDPSPPADPVKLIFIHHSCGGNWLADETADQPSSGLGQALMNNNYFVSATNYGWGPYGIGDRTDIPDWPEWFTGSNRDEIMHAVYSETGQNIGGFGDWTRMEDPDPKPAYRQGGAHVTYHWAPGTYEIGVEATNCGGTVSGERTITISSSGFVAQRESTAMAEGDEGADEHGTALPPDLTPRVYLPVILKTLPLTPDPTPTPTTSPSGDLIQPSNLVYQGAFRLPDSPGTPDNVGWAWSNWASAAAYYPGGDPGGPADGYPGSLFGVGHDHTQLVSEVSIPMPVNSPGKNVSALPTAGALQEFHDIRGDLFGALEMPRVGLAYLPAQGSQSRGKLYFAWAPHLDEGATNPSHGWSELDLSSPQSAGAWRIDDYWNYVTGDYVFEIPQAWADAHVSRRYLATGRYRDGGQGAEGPSLFAIAPWAEGNPPPPGSTLPATPLLLYGNAYEQNPPAMDHYHHSDEWTGGAWLTAGSKAAVVFVGNKGVGDCWYGCADGTDEPPWPPDCERGWWSTKIVGQFLFYDPADLAEVAQGMMEPEEPQPYATLHLDEVLYHVTSEQQKYHLGAAAFDRERGLLYVFEPFGDGDKPLVHVWRVEC
jgi:hypothetical protein